MRITREWVESCRTEKGGFTNAQIHILQNCGLIETQELKRGWIRHLVGKEISEENARMFLFYREMKAEKSRDMKEKCFIPQEATLF